MLRDVEVRRVTSRKSQYAFLLKGYDRSPISNVRVSDCTFDGVERDDILQAVRNVVFDNVRVNGVVKNLTR